MFRRRNPLPIHRRVKEVLWPSLGWGRAARYVGHRLGRLPGSPYRIAAGFACGAAVSFTPFMGFHFVLAMGLSLLLRGNVIASAVGTAVGNPWTFPLIWAWTFHSGRWLLGEVGRVPVYPESMTLTYIFEHPWQVLWPMTIGSLPTALVAWFVFFWPVRSMVSQYQKARRWRLRRKLRLQQRHAAGPVAGPVADGHAAAAPRGGPVAVQESPRLRQAAVPRADGANGAGRAQRGAATPSAGSGLARSRGDAE